jgi:hypothetical protein
MITKLVMHYEYFARNEARYEARNAPVYQKAIYLSISMTLSLHNDFSCLSTAASSRDIHQLVLGAFRTTFAHLLLEDGTQVVLYCIVASGNASSGTEDNAMQVIVVIAAGIQSLLFFLVKGYELFSEQHESGRGGSGRFKAEATHSRSRTGDSS